MAATTGITNLYLYLRYLNDANDDPTADSSELDTIRSVIDQANSLIGKKCARTFGSTEYKEWIETKGESYIVTNNYPITKIKLLASSDIDLLNIEATGFEVATVSSNNSALTLTSIASDGTNTETYLYYSTYANVSSIVTAIDLISGWDAEATANYTTSLTQNIRPVDSAWAVDEKVYLQGPYRGITGRVAYDSDAVINLGSDWWGDNGYCLGKYVFCWYVAGYTLPVCDESGGTLSTVGNVPAGLTLIANEIIKDYFDSKGEDRNMEREEQGDYKYIRDGLSSAIDRHWSDLNQYARKSV